MKQTPHMKHLSIYLLAAFILMAAQAVGAWKSFEFDLPSQAPESMWRDALSKKLHGQCEVHVEGGRIDVMTDADAIEVDWPHKWHEGLGQALHYSDATGKKGILALISYSLGPEKMKAKSRERFEMVEKYCNKHGIDLWILYPTKARLYGTEKGHKSLYGNSTNYWLNLRSGIRHRPGCRFYKSGTNGRPCGADEGRPCKFCGE